MAGKYREGLYQIREGQNYRQWYFVEPELLIESVRASETFLPVRTSVAQGPGAWICAESFKALLHGSKCHMDPAC